MLNYVVKISIMSAKYFEYYTTPLYLGGRFFRGHTSYLSVVTMSRLAPYP